MWEDAPRVFYSDHTHPTMTAHIILSGEMKLTVNGECKTYYPGDRCDVPVSTIHSALTMTGVFSWEAFVRRSPG